MAEALTNNTSLLTLDLSNNRIHPPALFEFIKGLENNKTLTNLKVCFYCWCFYSFLCNPVYDNVLFQNIQLVHNSAKFKIHKE